MYTTVSYAVLTQFYPEKKGTIVEVVECFCGASTTVSSAISEATFSAS